MAISKKYLSLEEAAALLKVKTEELIRLREKGDVRGFADRVFPLRRCFKSILPSLLACGFERMTTTSSGSIAAEE